MSFKKIVETDLVAAITIGGALFALWEWWKNRNDNSVTPAVAKQKIAAHDANNVRVYWPKGSKNIITINLKTQAKKFHDDLFSVYNDIPFARMIFYNTLHDDLAQVPDVKYAQFKQLYVEQFGTTPATPGTT